MMIFFQHINRTKAQASFFPFIFNDLQYSLKPKKRPLSIANPFLLACFYFFLTFPAHAINYYEEHQLSQALVAELPPNQIVWLKISDKPDVLSLFLNSTKIDNKGGVIILHDYNKTPDWPQIISPLRHYLPKFEWATLSIYMPTSSSEVDENQMRALYESTAQRINTGITFLAEKEIEPKVIIASGRTAGNALRFVSQKENHDLFKAIVIISAFDEALNESSQYIEQIPINILDIVAEHDSMEVIESAKSRLEKANIASQLSEQPSGLSLSAKATSLAMKKTGNMRYRQEIITGANHKYQKQTDELLKIIRGWMEKYRDI